MPAKIKMLLAIGLVAFTAACATAEEEVMVVEPVTEEPTYNKL